MAAFAPVFTIIATKLYVSRSKVSSNHIGQLSDEAGLDKSPVWYKDTIPILRRKWWPGVYQYQEDAKIYEMAKADPKYGEDVKGVLGESERERSRSRSQGRSKGREKSKSREKSKTRERSKSRERGMSRKNPEKRD